jgi:hypothetical protein
MIVRIVGLAGGKVRFLPGITGRSIHSKKILDALPGEGGRTLRKH